MAFTDDLYDALHGEPGEVVMDFEGRFFTRGELAGLADQIVVLLDRAGVPADASIGLIMRNRPYHVASVAGLVAARRPLTSIYALQSPSLLARDIEGTRFAAVIADAADMSSEVRRALSNVGAVGIALDLADGATMITQPFAVDGAYHRVEDGPCLEILSSGTTGKPKRIRFPYSMLARSLESVRAGFSSGPIPPDICTWSFAGIGMIGIIANFSFGRYMALMDRFNVPAWVEAVRRLRPAYVMGPPAVAQMIVDANVAPEDMASIGYFYGGSAPMPLQLQDALLEKYGVIVLWAYGATEFCGTIISWTLDLHHAFGAAKRGSMGRPLAGIQVRVVDTDTGEPVPTGAEGYLEALVPSVADHWIRTTDIATIDEDGFVFHRGRGDGAIMRGGFKILPETIARALARHPAVLDACVIGLADHRLGQAPVAAVQLRSDSPPVQPEDLSVFLRSELQANYIPKEIRIVDQLPRTLSLKVDLTAVRALFE